MKKESFSSSIGLIFIYIILSLLAGSIYLSLKIDNVIIDNICLTLIDLAVAFYIAHKLKDKLAKDRKKFMEDKKKCIKCSLKYWICGFILMIASNLLVVFLLNGIAPNEEANRTVLGMYPFYSIAKMCLIGPFVEELLFRLNFKGILKKRITYVLSTGILFGLMHVIGSFTSLSDFLYLLPYTVLGCTFSIICYDTDSVYSSILAHIVHNTVSVLIILANI